MAPLAPFVSGWPQTLRQEIALWLVVDARLAMPVELIENALRQGRVTFPRRTLRTWIQPTAPQKPSRHDETELELPLSAVAPLFLARQNGDGRPHRVTVNEAIPNLFFGLPKPGAAATPSPETNTYLWSDDSDTPRTKDAESSHRKPTGTGFAPKSVTPNEIISRATALEGVLGALIALPEGLLVAGRLPPEFNGDTPGRVFAADFLQGQPVNERIALGRSAPS